jgi:hypothetical protein
MYHDEQSIAGKWEKRNLVIFKDAIIRYLQILEPLKGEGNHDINSEITDWQTILQTINNEIEKLLDDRDQGSLPLYGKNYGKLCDILSKNCSAKKQLLDEARRKVLAEAAHQGKTEELEKINSVLSLDFWTTVNRKKALVDSFYPVEEPKQEQSVALQITIGNLYGQFAAFNNGTMIQNNNDAVEALKEVTDALITSKLSDTEKQDALADVQTIQSQLNKEKPNKSILNAALISLQTAANLAQVLTVVAPHFDKIQNFISQIPNLAK